MIEVIDVSMLSKMDPETARDEIRDVVTRSSALKNIAMSMGEQEDLFSTTSATTFGLWPAGAAAGAR
jgi:pilus assembly protein CpaF